MLFLVVWPKSASRDALVRRLRELGHDVELAESQVVAQGRFMHLVRRLDGVVLSACVPAWPDDDVPTRTNVTGFVGQVLRARFSKPFVGVAATPHNSQWLRIIGCPQVYYEAELLADLSIIGISDRATEG
jgi:hypothetical protein